MRHEHSSTMSTRGVPTSLSVSYAFSSCQVPIMYSLFNLYDYTFVQFSVYARSAVHMILVTFIWFCFQSCDASSISCYQFFALSMFQVFFCSICFVRVSMCELHFTETFSVALRFGTIQKHCLIFVCMYVYMRLFMQNLSRFPQWF